MRQQMVPQGHDLSQGWDASTGRRTDWRTALGEGEDNATMKPLFPPC